MLGSVSLYICYTLENLSFDGGTASSCVLLMAKKTVWARKTSFRSKQLKGESALMHTVAVHLVTKLFILLSISTNSVC